MNQTFERSAKSSLSMVENIHHTTSRISIIIVNWNTREDLLECLASLKGQILKEEMEIIVVDNNSKDGSQSAIKESYPEVSIIQNPDNYGFARANNIGIKVATGNHLFLVNSDVIVLKECFSKMLVFLENNPHVGMVGPKVLTVDGDIQRSCMGFPGFWNSICRALAFDALFPKSTIFGGKLLTFWSHNTLREVDVINGCFWLIRREAFKDVGFLDEEFFIYGEDVDWCKRFTSHGWKIMFYPDAEIIHKGGISSAKAPKRFYIELFRAEIKYWTKYHNKFSRTIYAFILKLHQVVRIVGNVWSVIIGRSDYQSMVDRVGTYWACMRDITFFEPKKEDDKDRVRL